ncbi:3-ketoacyl-CoA thiolase A, peroxisomal-like [Mytilus californianus]|uniref:3-ketoacyl-CoA thiolase A, peroxisomal-like n=1 Tax=Mytilus californianus TaxID=6549 RepID=UPI002247D749|nr:3-ketoacyl-CoA thiolase A, peroxisomal-like [Mytilus californianus]
MERISVMFNHLSSNNDVVFNQTASGTIPRFKDTPDDIVIVSALRTPIGKAKRGSFKDTYPDELLATALTAVIKQSGISPTQIGDICCGTVGDGRGAVTVRTGQFMAGIPDSVPSSAVNRQCSSGLQAVMNVAGSIRMGQCNMGIGAGVESMSFHRGENSNAPLNPKIFEHEMARKCLIPMGITSENVAEKYGITREQQDNFALASQQKALKATKDGLFKDEIIPVTVTFKDQDENERQITVTTDDGIRPSTIQNLMNLKPAFKKDGTTTAGNSSQVSDGAAAVLVAKRSEAERLGLPILGVIRGYAVVGCPPELMGIGPAVAIPEVLKKTGLSVNDIDIFEINEAFASQATYCVNKIGIPMEKVNPKGGAIALGHPLGCTGARQIGTLLHELKRRRNRSYGVVSMCIGTGMGAAGVFEYPGR